MQFKKLLATVGLTLAAVLPAQAAEPEFTFKLHHFLPPMSMAHQKFLQPWAEKVMKESNGRIKIDVFPAMQLGGTPPQLFDQARTGVVDMSWTVGGYTPGRFPKAGAFELPFIPANAEATSMALQEYAEEEMKDELSDVHILAVHTHAPGSLHSRDKEIRTAEDLNGMKVRAPNKEISEAFTLLGASPVFMPVTQMPSALSKGVVDVAVLPFEVVKPMKIHQLAGKNTEIVGDRGLYVNFFLFSMNKDSYNKLPADLKKVIDDNSGMALAQHIGQLFDESEKDGRDAAVAEGNTFYTLTPDETAKWKKAMQPVTDSWIADMTADGEDGKALYTKASNLIQKYIDQVGQKTTSNE
ncbi:TRAP transporter substrate-binding protein [Parathalassolituus penaei]|uniref:TRAP transporter substrate-binding protein n=1 Tax=Parathalassolituus penaei TaxID=2997323 RepID=A0A9X3ITC4_9GAMM|nr:TRAP transporter substrate-binding protein [Parathalassolituus penaei]MCY0966741.1 TRAP transporter substrate-binding protein [Parathalassolituus penaei]